MAYTKSYTAWADYPTTTTPATAAKLQNMDDGISTNDGSITTLTATVASVSATANAAAPLTTVAAVSSVAYAAIPKSVGSASGDIVFYTAASTPTRLGAGSSAQVLTISGGLPSWQTTAAISLSSASKALSAAVAFTAANTFFDGPSLTVAAGTWLFQAVLSVSASTTSAGFYTGKLWDGASSVLSSAWGQANVSGGLIINLVGVTAVTASTTIKASVAASVGAAAAIEATAPNNGAGATASTLVGIKLA